MAVLIKGSLSQQSRMKVAYLLVSQVFLSLKNVLRVLFVRESCLLRAQNHQKDVWKQILQI